MVYVRTDYSIHEPRRTTERFGDAVFDFHAQFNPIDEPRTDAEQRIVGEFRDQLKRRLDKGDAYGIDEGHGKR